METVSENAEVGSKLQITFPKSDQDHRLQLVHINGAMFAILFAPLESLGPIKLYCEKWSLILLAPLKSKSNILVSAINLICLSEIASEEGSINLHASNRLVKFSDLIKPTEKVCQIGEKGEFQFDNDPGALLSYYRLFEGIVTKVKEGSPDALSQAQEQFIGGLCRLADTMEGNPENLDLKKVFGVWNIPVLTL